MSDRGHHEHDQLRAWLGLADADDFDPDGFSVSEANEALAGLLAWRGT
jgi:hypothetical protein